MNTAVVAVAQKLQDRSPELPGRAWHQLVGYGKRDLAWGFYPIYKWEPPADADVESAARWRVIWRPGEAC